MARLRTLRVDRPEDARPSRAEPARTSRAEGSGALRPVADSRGQLKGDTFTEAGMIFAFHPKEIEGEQTDAQRLKRQELRKTRGDVHRMLPGAFSNQ